MKEKEKMADKAIGREAFGMKAIGRRIGKRSKTIKERNREIRRKIEGARDKTRMKLLETRKNLKERERNNELKMKRKKMKKEPNNNPTVVSTMPSREYAKMLRNPANWSSVPPKPKLSRALTHRKRIYGKRFD